MCNFLRWSTYQETQVHVFSQLHPWPIKVSCSGKVTQVQIFPVAENQPGRWKFPKCNWKDGCCILNSHFLAIGHRMLCWWLNPRNLVWLQVSTDLRCMKVTNMQCLALVVSVDMLVCSGLIIISCSKIELFWFCAWTPKVGKSWEHHDTWCRFSLHVLKITMLVHATATNSMSSNYVVWEKTCRTILYELLYRKHVKRQWFSVDAPFNWSDQSIDQVCWHGTRWTLGSRTAPGAEHWRGKVFSPRPVTKHPAFFWPQLMHTVTYIHIQSYIYIYTYIYTHYIYIYIIYIHIIYTCIYVFGIYPFVHYIFLICIYFHIYLYMHINHPNVVLSCFWHLYNLQSTLITSLNRVVLGEHRSWQPLPVFIDPHPQQTANHGVCAIERGNQQRNQHHWLQRRAWQAGQRCNVAWHFQDVKTWRN